MGFDDGRDHPVFGHFAGKAFDHQDRILAARDDQIEIAFFQFVLRGEGDELAADLPEPNRADRPLERQRRQAEAAAAPFIASTSPSFCRSLASTKL